MASPMQAFHLFRKCTSFSRTSQQLQHLSVRHLTASRRQLYTSRELLHADVSKQRPAHLPSASTTINRRPESIDSNSLPAYTAPTNGILSLLPASWVPYAELIRIDKPVGTNYLFFPCLFSTLLAAPLATPIASPTSVIGTAALFYAGAVIMRGAGCTINDLWDRNLDPKVARTRLRPIARGAISVNQAIPFLGAQLLAGLAVLLQFPTECFFYATPSLLLVAVYPLAKRVTYYPQFVLGLTFSWGAFLGFPALGVDLLSNTPALISAVCLYSSCVAWTLVYDMIYAYQDIRDDAKAGIKSIALAYEANAKVFLSTVATVQIALLGAAGYVVGAGSPFFMGSCVGGIGSLYVMIKRVNLSDVKDCWLWFKRGAWFVGGTMALGLGADYTAQYAKPEVRQSQLKQV